MGDFDKGRYEEFLGRIILILDQHFRGRHRLKIFLFLALPVIWLGRVEPVGQCLIEGAMMNVFVILF